MTAQAHAPRTRRTSELTGLDTNVWVRYYVHADQTDAHTQAQCEAARRLIESGKPLFMAKTVALELEWVLRGFYELKPSTVSDVFKHLLAMPHLQMEDRIAVELAHTALAQGFDFADALHHASSRQCSELVTFDDKRFARRAQQKGWQPRVVVPRA